MNNETKFNLKNTLLLLLLLVTFTVNAQDKRRVFALKQGDEFQREILTNSKAVIQRGKQTLSVNSVSSLTKSYVVTSTSANGNVMNVKIKKMDNLIDALGQRLQYNSESRKDSSSIIERALNHMVNKPVEVTVDKNGVILYSNSYKSEMATDTLVAFAGIEPEIFERGTLLNLFADVTYNPSIKKGFTWTDSVQINGQKLNTKFWVEDITPKNTIIKFSTKIVSQLINSNSNGTYIVDNESGLIIEKLVYTISTGYQISAGRVIYAVSRSTSLSEKIKKVTR
ncbi:DUF6263 family protein [Pedobacter sp. Hv1]|uniref:DUF6263 family protein n=1 Tax=Pedobacter sp. Hv1 TaxID=1740090 RepID=UPI0006D88E84|nr:DUF6263 family protein [Pedobacter sp. Hv1]KQB99995.1 hypothetical protein AQF98_15940 [Pedobacter sp. Hv1]